MRFANRASRSSATWRRRPGARELDTHADSAVSDPAADDPKAKLTASAPQPFGVQRQFLRAVRLPDWGAETSSSDAEICAPQEFVLLHFSGVEFLRASATCAAAMLQGASRPDLQVGYYDLLRMTDERKADLGCVLLEVGGIEAFTRWAEARARHHPWGSRARPGFAPGTVEALRAAQSQLILCTCGALVHLQSARAQARKAGRCFIVRGDGCGSSLCSDSHVQPGRFARRQIEMPSAI